MDINEEIIEKVKQETDICNTCCCFENCKHYVTKYIEYKENEKREKFKMNKNDLKNKMVIELGNKERYLIIDDSLNGEVMWIH